MKILVCISVTPDTTSKITFKNDNTEFNAEGVQYIINPYDEWYALVKALEIKEQTGGTVTVIHMGPPAHDVMIRKALAIGADDAIRINSIADSSLQLAKNIVAHAKDFDIIFLGKETLDYQSSEVGAMVAELLDLPFISYASRLSFNEGTATVYRDIEGGVEVIEIKPAFVISASKGMAEQRIPNMKGIMTAKSKPLQVVEPISEVEQIKYLSYQLPPAKKGVTMIDANHAEELISILHEKEKLF
ncbi:MAG: electron transfer flavoprotein subunit beta/FixA family protein [Saprospiraceae bacterium]